MTFTSRALVIASAVAALIGIAFVPPAAAQFEEPIPSTEERDSIDIAVTPNGAEWWVAETDGQVATAPLGDPQETCPPPENLRGYVRSIDRTPSGHGYWLATSYGRVITCGDARHFGDLPNMGVMPSQPIVGIAATPEGDGYWLAASDGGVFSFGGARFEGSMGDIRLNQPVVGIEAAADGDGYWLVATDGGIFTFGDADFHGSAGDIDLRKPIVDMARNESAGYYLLGEDGGVFTFGDATFHGSRWSRDDMGDGPYVGIEFAWTADGYFVADFEGNVHTFGTTGTRR